MSSTRAIFQTHKFSCRQPRKDVGGYMIRDGHNNTRYFFLILRGKPNHTTTIDDID